MSNAITSLGTTLSWNGTAIAEVSKIDDVAMSAKPIEVTHLGSTAREYISGILEANEIKIEGNFIASDTNGQIALKSAVGGASGTLALTLPTGTGAAWSATALVTKFSCGKAEAGKDSVPFTASFQITGTPVLGLTASTGLTTPFFVISNSAVLTPSASGSVYDYVATVLTAVTSVTVTPTATAGVITVNGNTVATGVASSAIPLGAAGSVTTITITVTETAKVPKTYTVKLARL